MTDLEFLASLIIYFRELKDYERSDRLRKILQNMGYEVRNIKEGVELRIKPKI